MMRGCVVCVGMGVGVLIVFMVFLGSVFVGFLVCGCEVFLGFVGVVFVVLGDFSRRVWFDFSNLVLLGRIL